MKLALRQGITSYRTRIFVQDTTQSNVKGLTGLAFNTSGLKWYYLRDGDAAATAVTPATATVGTWTSSGFKEIDATNMPGWYELGIPNAALATGDVGMMLSGALNMGVVNIEIQVQGMPLDLLQPIVAHALENNLRGVFNAAASFAAGRIVQSGTDFKIYCFEDETTLLVDQTLDSATNPQSRA